MTYSLTQHIIARVCVGCLLLLFLTLPSIAVADAEHDDHGTEHTEDEGEMELQMVFAASNGDGPVHLLWTKPAQEETLHLYFVKIGNGIQCGAEQNGLALTILEEMLESIEVLELNYTEIEPMDTIAGTIAAEMHGAHEGEDEVVLLTYLVQFASTNCTAVFSKHSAEEKGLIFFNATSGMAIVPSYVHVEQELRFAVSEVAGSAIGAAIIVSLIPLFLLVLVLPVGLFKDKEALRLVFFFLQAFGCGALLAVVTLHIYPEVILELNEQGIPMWNGGALTLGAICMIATIHFLAHRIGKHNHDMDAATAAEQLVGEETAEPAVNDGTKDVEAMSVASSATPSPTFRLGTCRDIIALRSVHPLVWGLTIGDSLHNFVDGTIIATAFLTCGATGWITVGAIVAHEIPQELGDFAVMLGKGTPVTQAAAFNIIAQFFALLGCGITLAVGASISTGQLALLVAFGAGTFLFIALAEIMPMLLKARTPVEMALVAAGLLTAFTAIGLATMGDEGCGGHNH